MAGACDPHARRAAVWFVKRKRFLAHALLIACAGCGALPTFEDVFPRTAHELQEILSLDGTQRRYRVYVPSSYESAAVSPRPLVLAFHGWGQSAAGMSRLTGLDELAEKYDFIIAYPEAIDGNWNDGRPNINPTVDDVSFVRELIDALESQYRIDPKRIYATGLSNGGHMCNRLAIEMSDRIAAVAPVAAVISKALSQSPVAGQPVPLLLIEGDADPVTPYGGGIVGRAGINRGEVLSADATITYWVARNHAASQAAVLIEPDVDPRDGTRVRRATYAKSEQGAGAEVEFLRIEGGGHTWPQGLQYLPESLIGRTSRDVSASEEIWEFFSRQALP